MLTNASLYTHMTPSQQGAQPYPYEGRPDGMAADTLFRSPLTVQQEVPNIGPSLTAPKTKVNPTLEQGWGRSPGWKNGWMRKNIPADMAAGGKVACARLGQVRAEGILNSGLHAPGTGQWQSGHATQTPKRGVIAQPETVYLTADVTPQGAHAVTGSWGEPL
jgi:hypothetical protein